MTDSDFIVAIPARHGASRLPGKPLRLLGGEPLIRHVVRRAVESGAVEVVVATDDERIAAAVDGQGAEVCLTRADHASGSDRLAECAGRLGWDDSRIVVNLQGDEPFVPAKAIRALAGCLAASSAPMATLAEPIEAMAQIFDPNVVKLVRDAGGRALYFSRAPIPWARARFGHDRLGAPGEGWLRHIGLYAYRAGFLRRFGELPVGRLERIEALEQLRVLEAGHAIEVALSPCPVPPGIDTEQDLRRAEAWLEAAGGT